MIRDFEPIDDETPIEEYPGYIGHTWDHDFCPGPDLEVLASFDLQEYFELFRPEETRQLILRKPPEAITCEVYDYCSWPHMLSQLPSVTACLDEGPPNAGPASGTGYVFFLSEGTTRERLVKEVTSLRQALDGDLKELRERPE